MVSIEVGKQRYISPESEILTRFEAEPGRIKSEEKAHP